MEIQKNKNKVLLGLSGGVDSTAAALLLKENGYQVTGYFFDVLGTNKDGQKEAQALADKLGIELICEDVSAEFEEKIVKTFCQNYLDGKTPNPCVICNPYIKFKKLIEKADQIGSYYISTGHYCRISYDENTKKYFIRQGANSKKDQSYMLYRLNQDVLSRLIFPLGELEEKEQIRALARNYGLQNAEKKDSQEICFIDSDSDYTAFMKNRGLSSKKGNFVNSSGEILGQHEGILNYTIGQRKGLGIALGKPAFVTCINSKTNEVTLGSNADLFNTKVTCTDYFFTANNADFYNNKKVLAKVRYSAENTEALIEVYNNKIMATFEEPQRAATPGQSIVFYEGENVIGGGFIE